ncbi:hypothetical protein Mgra_00003473 [Meloidogyne graminicola]|uniref:Lipase_GDSL domain-containing protein n=1 Tax=Meloidogyne graminicola TaxID=189291 RepID=A0A8S9ZVB4_9BILA|nr:hypothetical protein Mgra_00003473 [Meloidogyne graminicola]
MFKNYLIKLSLFLIYFLLFLMKLESQKIRSNPDLNVLLNPQNTLKINKIKGEKNNQTLIDNLTILKEDKHKEEVENSEEDEGEILTQIENLFQNRKTFTCPKVKQLLVTGSSAAELSPEDIDVVAAMGDALSTGLGLYKGKNIEFRGAAFTVGGDANIDGFVTFANILSIFNPKLEGISHGMGSLDSLPFNQFNVAESGAETDGMPEQAKELISRLNNIYTREQLKQKWIMLFITVGTEEFCAKCDPPNVTALRHSLKLLRKSIKKLFIVLVGPIHVARSSAMTYNLLKPRCPCLSKISNSQLGNLQQTWRKALTQLELEFYEKKNKNPTFALLALSKLKIGIDSKQPLEQLFLSKSPLLNSLGHTYAAKWLWNRLIAGSRYNLSSPNQISIAEESYFCPSLGCPYFRTLFNVPKCVVRTRSEFEKRLKSEEERTFIEELTGRRRLINENLIFWILIPILLSLLSVISFGTIFFLQGLKSKKGRFEVVPGV